MNKDIFKSYSSMKLIVFFEASLNRTYFGVIIILIDTILHMQSVKVTKQI